MQGASPVSLQYLPEFFTPEPQQEDLPPGLLEHSEPPHAPQLVGQQTELPRLMPGMSPGHVWAVRSKTRDVQASRGIWDKDWILRRPNNSHRLFVWRENCLYGEQSSREHSVTHTGGS